MLRAFVSRSSWSSWLALLVTAASYLSDFDVSSPSIAVAQDDSKLVAVQRQKLIVTSADKYRLPLRLEPVRSVTINAPCDGVVKTVAEKEGRAVNAQFEIVRVENPRLDLVSKRATAAKELAQQELRIARSTNNAEQIKLGETKVALAEAEWSLAIFDQQATGIRAPYAATILKLHVSEGQQVRAGEPLVSVGAVSQLKCRLPIDRDVVKVGGTMDLTVESQTLTVVVDSVTPLDAEHDKLRELAVSAASAVVKLDNAKQLWHPGQVVYGPLAPRGAVTSVPLNTVKSDAAGNRIVQVIRDGIIRSVPVTLHGQIGKELVYVSGTFGDNDELVTAATRELADGTALRPATTGQVSGRTPQTLGQGASTATPPPSVTIPGKKANAAGL